jgi:hypothetical protein
MQRHVGKGRRQIARQLQRAYLPHFELTCIRAHFGRGYTRRQRSTGSANPMVAPRPAAHGATPARPIKGETIAETARPFTGCVFMDDVRASENTVHGEPPKRPTSGPRPSGFSTLTYIDVVDGPERNSARTPPQLGWVTEPPDIRSIRDERVDRAGRPPPNTRLWRAKPDARTRRKTFHRCLREDGPTEQDERNKGEDEREAGHDDHSLTRRDSVEDHPIACQVVSGSVRLSSIVLPEQVTSEIVLQVAPDRVNVIRAAL